MSICCPASNMSGNTKTKPEPRLTLHSRIEDLQRLASWVDALATEYVVPDDTRFAIDLCLEEALSNIIRHGYRAQIDQPITVDCKAVPPHDLVFIIEDQAPPFDPLAYSSAEDMPPPSSIDQLAVGGRGIYLMRKFAGTLAYRRLPRGNRLTIGFPLYR